MNGADERRRPAMRAAALLVLLSLAAGTLLGACDEAGTSASPGQSIASSQPVGGSGVIPGGGPGTAPSPLDSLIATLRDGMRSERADAAGALGRLGDRAAVPALMTALGDESWTVRESAATALGVLRDPAAVDALLALIAVEPSPAATDDLSSAVAACDAAVTALGSIGDARAVSRLVAISLDDATALDHAGAQTAIVAIGPGAVARIAALLSVASSADAAPLAELMARLGDPGFGPLVKALSNKRVAVRVAAATALDGFGARAGKPLIAVLRDKNTGVRNAAAHALGVIRATGATAALVKLLATSATRRAAINALVVIYRDNATPLVRYLRSRSTILVYRPLIRIGQANTVSALAKALRSFGDKTMGETYLNCGNPTLEKAARAWGSAHGYVVVPSGGVDGEGWGSH